MLLDLTKPKPMPVNPPAPVPALPIPPPLRTIGDVRTPREPSRLWCFFGIHKWVIHTETTWKKTYDGQVMAQGPMYILRCTVCGKMKHEKL